MSCYHAELYECHVRNIDKIIAICLKCLTATILNEDFSQIKKTRCLQKTIELMENSLELILKIDVNRRCEIIFVFTNCIKVENSNDYNELICKIIILLFNQTDDQSYSLTYYLKNFMDEVTSHPNESNCLKYFIIMKGIVINLENEFLSIVKSTKGMLLRDLVTTLTWERDDIRSVTVYILNVLIDHEIQMISFLNLPDLATQLLEIIVERDVCQDDSLFTNCIVLIVLLFRKSDAFQNSLMETGKVSFLIRKLLLLQSTNKIYCTYGVKILDILLSSDANDSHIVTEYFTKSSNIAEYLFDLLIYGKNLIPLTLRCLMKFVECKIFCETNNCAYGLMNILRCGQTLLETEPLQLKTVEVILKLLNQIMLNYCGNVLLFVNESMTTSLLQLLKSMIAKTATSLYLLSCQTLNIFLNRYSSIRPFPYQDLIGYLDLFESIKGNMFKTRHIKTSNTTQGSSDVTLRNRCIFINLHVDFVYELIRFAKMDRSNLVPSEEIDQQITTIHGYAYSIFFSTYLRYLMSIIRRKTFVNNLSVDRFLQVTQVVLSDDLPATKASLKMIFSDLISSLLTLNSQIRIENNSFNIQDLEAVTVKLLEICTLDFQTDLSVWRKIISNGISLITDCSIENLFLQCSSDHQNLNSLLTCLWMLCSVVECHNFNSRDNERFALLDCFVKICNDNLLDDLATSPAIFSVKLIKIIKVSIDKSSEINSASHVFLQDFIAKVYLSIHSQLDVDILEYLLLEIHILKLINSDSSLCMGSSQSIISQTFLSVNRLCNSDLLAIMNCNNIDLINVVTVFSSVFFNKETAMIESLDWALSTVVKYIITNPQSKNENSQFPENLQQQLIDVFWSLPDKLYMNCILQDENNRVVLWRFLDAVFLCSSIFRETVPLLKITSLMVEFLKDQSTNVAEVEIMYKLILKASLNDESSNIISQLITVLLNDEKGRLILSPVSQDSMILNHRKTVLIAILIVSTEPNHNCGKLENIQISGTFLLQCIDHCSQFWTPLTQICGFIILQKIFCDRKLVDTSGPCLLDPELILQIVSIIYTSILDRSNCNVRQMAVVLFGQLVRFCISTSSYAHLEEQIISSVWIEIIIQHLLQESLSTDDNDCNYSSTCLNFLSQILESSSPAINLSVSASTWRNFSVWFVHHHISDLPIELANCTSQLVFKMASHSSLNCFNEAERICLLKKLAVENPAFDTAQLPDENIKSKLLLNINNLLGL